MISGIFLIAGLNHVLFPKNVASRLMETTIYKNVLFFMNTEILVIATGAGLLTGGIFFVFNQFTRMVAIVLLVLLAGITISVQFEGWHTSGPLFKNIAIAGGLIFFIVNKFDSSKQ
jgi:putative oxidoreductase